MNGACYHLHFKVGKAPARRAGRSLTLTGRSSARAPGPGARGARCGLGAVFPASLGRSGHWGGRRGSGTPSLLQGPVAGWKPTSSLCESDRASPSRKPTRALGWNEVLRAPHGGPWEQQAPSAPPSHSNSFYKCSFFLSVVPFLLFIFQCSLCTGSRSSRSRYQGAQLGAKGSPASALTEFTF